MNDEGALFTEEDIKAAGWLRTKDNLDKLQDHYFYLVTHPKYRTPIKAKYHDDAGGHFSFPHYPDGIVFVDPIFRDECECKYFMELPDMPYDYALEATYDQNSEEEKR